jgi:hypothetical protein
MKPKSIFLGLRLLPMFKLSKELRNGCYRVLLITSEEAFPASARQCGCQLGEHPEHLQEALAGREADGRRRVIASRRWCGVN